MYTCTYVLLLVPCNRLLLLCPSTNHIPFTTPVSLYYTCSPVQSLNHSNSPTTMYSCAMLVPLYNYTPPPTCITPVPLYYSSNPILLLQLCPLYYSCTPIPSNYSSTSVHLCYSCTPILLVYPCTSNVTLYYSCTPELLLYLCTNPVPLYYTYRMYYSCITVHL